MLASPAERCIVARRLHAFTHHGMARRGSPGGLCLLLVAPSTSWALNPRTLISQYTTDHWRTEDGLPQASVGAIAQTADGYIWLATEEGLVRFDGVRFTVFDTTNSALTDNYISSLLAGRDGVAVDPHARRVVSLRRRAHAIGVRGPLDRPRLHADARRPIRHDLEPVTSAA